MTIGKAQTMSESNDQYVQRRHSELNTEIGILHAAIEIACRELRNAEAAGKPEWICGIVNKLERTKEISAEHAAKQVAERAAQAAYDDSPEGRWSAMASS